MEIAAVTAFLAPFLPALLRGSQELVEEAVKGMGHKAWEFATRLWQKLAPRLEAKPGAAEAADDVAHRPDDARARGALELQLEKMLSEDPGFARELEQLWAEGQREGVVAAVGQRSVAIGGNVTGTIVTGDQNTISK
jgi:hypothetical protein